MEPSLQPCSAHLKLLDLLPGVCELSLFFVYITEMNL